jgi:hypothetical protein
MLLSLSEHLLHLWTVPPENCAKYLAGSPPWAGAITTRYPFSFSTTCQGMLLSAQWLMGGCAALL